MLEPRDKENSSLANSARPRLRVLLVEDDANDVELLHRAFRSSGGLQLDVVYHGQEALEHITAHDNQACWPDLIICDLNMPVMNGFEFLQWLKGQSPCPLTPLVVLTSSAVETDVTRAYQMGVAAYLVKPSSHTDLEVLAKSLVNFWRFVNIAPIIKQKPSGASHV